MDRSISDSRVLSFSPRLMSLAVTLSRAQEGCHRAPSHGGSTSFWRLAQHPYRRPTEAAVREARDRVRVAIQSAAFEYPNRKVTVNLAPAELPKDGGRFDLAIALGILAAGRSSMTVSSWGTGFVRPVAPGVWRLAGPASRAGAWASRGGAAR